MGTEDTVVNAQEQGLIERDEKNAEGELATEQAADS
jgi:hypothetical protein